MSRTYSGSTATFFGKTRNILPVTEIVADVARRLWPSKTARHLSSRAHVTHRAAEYWLGQLTGMSADALANLIRSDAGREILEAIMGDDRPSWWPAFRIELTFSELEAREQQNRAAIEDLKRAIAERRAR